MDKGSYLQFVGEFVALGEHYHLHSLHFSVNANETSCDNFNNCTTTENNTTPLPGQTTAPPDTTSAGAAIAAVLGVILLVLLVVCIVVLVVWLMRRRKRTKRDVLGNVCKHTLHTYVCNSKPKSL